MKAAITSATRESDPDRAAGLAAHLADEGVDPATEDVADDEEQKELRSDRAAKPALLLFRGIYAASLLGTLPLDSELPQVGETHT